MKRGLAMLAALLLLLGLMSGCGGSDTSAATASDMVATEETADNGSYGGNMAAQVPESPAEDGSGEDRTLVLEALEARWAYLVMAQAPELYALSGSGQAAFSKSLSF